MPLTDTRLSIRIQLSVLTLVSAAVLALVLVLDSHQRKSMLAELDDEMDMNVRLNNAHLQLTIDTLRQDALFLSRTPPISGIARATLNGGIDPRDNNPYAIWVMRLQEIFTAFAQTRPGYFQIRYIGVADGGRELVRIEQQAGQVLTVPAESLQAKDDLDYVREALRLLPGEIYLSEFDLNRENGKEQVTQIATLRAATPVFTPEGKLFGLVVINMDADALLKIDSTKMLFPASIYVANQDGYYLVHPDATRTYRFEGDSGARLTRDFPTLTEAFNPSQPLRQPLHPVNTPMGVQYAMTHRLHFDPRRPERFLVTANLLPESVVAGELAPHRQAVLISGLMATLLLGTFAMLFIKRLLTPLRRISTAALAIAGGERQVVLPEGAYGEVGALSDAFRAMLAQITEREADWQRLNAELEDQVITRTGELRVAASVYENTSEGAMIANERGGIISVNPAFTRITGYTSEEAVGRSCNLLKSYRHEPAFYVEMWQKILGENHWEGEIWNRRKNGEAYLERLTINRIPAINGFPVTYVGVFHDITEQYLVGEQIRHQAFHDALTGLPNRALFQERLSHAMARAKRDGSRLSVTFIDLDGFKAVNDDLGHDAGDLLLQEVAERINARLRRSMDTVARLGGDEFVVLREDLRELTYCTGLAEEMVAAISQPMILQGRTVQVGASLGIAFFPEDGGDALELMKRADIAMYAAKAAGKGTFRFFQTGML